MTSTQNDDTVTIGERMYTVVHSSSIIEAEGKTGQKFWQGHIVRDGDWDSARYYTCTSSWKATKGGGTSKVVWSEPYYAEPKNIGRANETTNYTQVLLEFESMVKKEQDKRLSDKPLPMLAQSYSKRASKITFPACVQPKYDGMRVLFNGEEAWSRGNKPVIPEVFAHLKFDTKGYIVDGELLLPGNQKVNKTMEAAKKYRPELSSQLLYVVYDIVEETLPFSQRYIILEQLIKGIGNPNVILADTVLVGTADTVQSQHKDFTDAGFEGTMIRNWHGKYSVNKRSDDLQKYKDFTDAEYEIVDIIPSGGGSAAEVGKFVCITENGDRFESTAMGDEAYRREILENKHLYIGKYAKVKFREMSGKNNVPFHSNVLEIRDSKDGGF